MLIKTLLRTHIIVFCKKVPRSFAKFSLPLVFLGGFIPWGFFPRGICSVGDLFLGDLFLWDFFLGGFFLDPFRTF